MEESKIPCNKASLFRKSDVIRFEREICQVLLYRLNPDTYVHSLNLLICQWEEFVIERPELLSLRYTSPDKGSYTRLRTVYDIADCVHLDSKSFEFQRADILATLLYIITRKFYLGLSFSFLKF